VGLLDNSTKAGRNLEKLCVALRPCTDGAIWGCLSHPPYKQQWQAQALALEYATTWSLIGTIKPMFFQLLTQIMRNWMAVTSHWLCQRRPNSLRLCRAGTRKKMERTAESLSPCW
jgi:hypothetical protein